MLKRWIVIAAALALLLGVIPVSAVGPTGMEPLSAPYLDSELHTIGANSTLWYRFDYKGDESPIVLKMHELSDFNTNFEVFAPSQILEWWKEDAVGFGSDEVEDHVWSGSFATSGTYYVRVVNNEPYDIDFHFLIEGAGLTVFPAVTAPVIAPKTATPMANTDPARALPLDAAKYMIAPNTSLWYRFEFAGDQSQATLTLLNGAASDLQFKVYDLAGMATWWKADPIGNGSVDGDHLLWVGPAGAGVVYYIEVVNPNAYAVDLQFMLTYARGPF